MAKPTATPIGANSPAVSSYELWRNLITDLGGTLPVGATMETIIQNLDLALFNNALPNAAQATIGPTNTLAITVNRQLVNSVTTAISTGVLYLARVYLPQNTVVSNLNFMPGTTGDAGPTHQWMGLWGGTSLGLLASSADATTAAITASTPVAYPVATVAAGAATSFTTAASNLHIIGLCITTGNAPTMAGVTGQATVNTLPPILTGTATGANTPPAIGTTLGTITGTAFTPMMWVS